MINLCQVTPLREGVETKPKTKKGLIDNVIGIFYFSSPPILQPLLLLVSFRFNNAIPIYITRVM